MNRPVGRYLYAAIGEVIEQQSLRYSAQPGSEIDPQRCSSFSEPLSHSNKEHVPTKRFVPQSIPLRL